MPRPRNIAKIIDALKLTEAEKAVVRDLLKVDPRVAMLQERRAAMVEQLEALDAEIAAGLSGGKVKGKRRGRKAKVATKVGRRRGRKPGRKPGKVAKVAKRGRKPGKRGLRRPPKAKPAAKVATVKATPKRKRKAMTPEQRTAMLERLAKARAVRMANLKAKG